MARKTTLAATALAALVLSVPGIAAAAPAPSIAYAQVTNESLVFQGQPRLEVSANVGDPWQIRNMVTKQILQTGTVDATQTISPNLTSVGSYRLEIGETRAHFAIVGATPADDPFYGAVTHHQWTNNRAWANPDNFLPDLKKVGISSVRDGGYWDEIETTKGEYQLPAQVENYFGAVQQTGTDQTFLATWTNELHGMEYRVPPQTSEQRQAYAAYILDTIAKNPNITRVEIWNEFNHEGFNKGGCLTGTCYVEAFAETADILRAARPDIEVIGGVIAGISPTWFREFFAAGGADHFDAVSWHPYRMMDMLAYEQQVNSIDAIQDEYLKPGQERLNYVISEVGWSTAPLENEGNRARAKDDLVLAERLVYTYMLNDALDVDSVYWYVAANRGGNPNLTEQNFGLFYSATDRITANQPKPATVALWNMRDQVQGLELTESGRLAANDRIWKTEYSSNAPECIVLWSINNMAPELPADIAAIDVSLADVVPAGMRAVSSVDAYGTPIPLDSAAVSVSSRAVYLTVAPIEPEPTSTATATAEPTPTAEPTVTTEPTASAEPPSTSTAVPTSSAASPASPTTSASMTASATPIAVVSITPAATPGANTGEQGDGPDALATTGPDAAWTWPAALGLVVLALGAALLARRRNELAAPSSDADETG